MSASNTPEVKTLSHPTAPILVSSAEVEIMRALRRQGIISRSEVSNITGWSKAKTSQEIRSLVSKGYLVEMGEGTSQGGRRPGLLKINDQLGYLVGLDIGATSIDTVLADVGGKVLQRRISPADVRQSPEEFLSRCNELILEMVKAQGCRNDQVLGIGV